MSTAKIKDYHERTEDGKIRGYRFRFGDCEDFHKTLEQFKKRIPHTERVPQPEAGWLWEVKSTRKNARALCQIFENFSQCMEIYRSQMKMFE